MFDTLFTRPSTIACHINAPYREEREHYLRHCEQQGYTRSTLLLMARELRWISQKLVIHPDHGVSIEEVKAAANGWKKREYFCGQKLSLRWTRIRFIQVARSWLRFLGYWREPEHLLPFTQLLIDYKIWMQDERGLTSETIERRCGLIKQFFLWYGNQGTQLSSVSINDVDAFLGHYVASGNCRISVKNIAMALRAFFKYAESRGWCLPGFSLNIHGLM